MSETKGRLILIVGPSCSGKTHLLKSLMTFMPDDFCRLISFTTRERRSGEVDGEEFHFVSLEDVGRFERNGDVIESVVYAGAVRGARVTDLQSALESGKAVLKIVEPSGVHEYKEAAACFGFEVVTVFCVASEKEILARWIDRCMGTAASDLSDSELQERLDSTLDRILLTLKQEVQWIDQGSYQFYFDPASAPFQTLCYALQRVAQGRVSRDMIPRLAPRQF